MFLKSKNEKDKRFIDEGESVLPGFVISVGGGEKVSNVTLSTNIRNAWKSPFHRSLTRKAEFTMYFVAEIKIVWSNKAITASVKSFSCLHGLRNGNLMSSH